MKFVKPQHFIIPYHVYPYNLYVSINESDKKMSAGLKKWVRKSDKKQVDIFMEEKCKGLSWIFDGGKSIIRFTKFKNNNESIGDVAHEAFHAVEFLFDWIKLKYDIDTSSETWAYLLGYITTNIYNNIKGL